MEDLTSRLHAGVETALLDRTNPSDPRDRPQFLKNDYLEGKKVLSSIEEELRGCDAFLWSIAFITMSGIVPLLPVLKMLEQNNIPGKILTTDYLTFSEPKALEKLSQFKNIQVKMAQVEPGKPGFHTKGYLFFHKDTIRIIIGSSNMTQMALTTNQEWNVRVVSKPEGELSVQMIQTFDTLWNDPRTRPYSEIKVGYEKRYKETKAIQKVWKADQEAIEITQELNPNAMQKKFISHLHHLVNKGKKRALLISATGTGKTYASAFAMRALGYKKVLFIVHRELIAKQAQRSFRLVFGNKRTMGLYTSKEKENADYLFTTMQMMAKEENRTQFDPEQFDAIIIDEVHRAGAMSYQKIFSYFQPKLWLGMSATPERSDNFDIYALFDHNIAYEIRLNQALEADLLCPFHYFGIQDLSVEEEQYDFEEFRRINLNQRVAHIIEQAKFYGYSGERVKGLVFVSRIEEARLLSHEFNKRGFHTVCLTGGDSQEYREKCIARLSQPGSEGRLDYIFTVEIFNEGIDIPSVNQVILLRPTQSPIIYVQQIGRGLRKDLEKEFVVILDFIGNYQTNYMIPVALSSDRTYNKDTLRRFVMEGERMIPGCSTIHFDEVAREKIFRSIDQANLQTLKLLKESYQQLRWKLGRTPTLIEFDEFGSIDPLKIIDYSGSYPAFLMKYEKTHLPRLSKLELKNLEYVSKKFASGKRIHELLLIEILLNKEKRIFSKLEERLEKEYAIQVGPYTKTNLINLFTNQFASGTGKATYANCILIQEKNGDYEISERFSDFLQNEYFVSSLKEVVKFGIQRYKDQFSSHVDHSPFVLYEKYTYEDVCRLLDWEKGEVALNIGGYKYDSKTKTYPVFINYQKDESIADTIKYEDRFLSPTILRAISKSKRTLESEDVQKALQAKELGIEMYLFVRKNKDDKQSKEFYYLGKIFATGQTEEIQVGKENAVEIEYKLETPVRQDIYDYLTR